VPPWVGHMKIGFLDSIFNYADVFEDVVEVLNTKIPAVSIERMTVPHLLKIPLFSKLLFDKGTDAVIVFLTMLEEDASELDLVHEKIIDLEIAEKKAVFFCIISDTEFKDEIELKSVLAHRLGIIAEAVAKVASSPGSLSSDIANQDLTTAMSMFGSMAQSVSPEIQVDNAESVLSGLDVEKENSGSKSLF
jgi:riboflavin synthase